MVYLLFYAIFVGMLLYGTDEALRIMFVITVGAVVAIVVFVVGMSPNFDPANLFDIAPKDAAGASSFLPFGYLGIWAAFPYAIWFSWESKACRSRPRRPATPRGTCLRGLIVAMFALLALTAF